MHTSSLELVRSHTHAHTHTHDTPLDLRQLLESRSFLPVLGAFSSLSSGNPNNVSPLHHTPRFPLFGAPALQLPPRRTTTLSAHSSYAPPGATRVAEQRQLGLQVHRRRQRRSRLSAGDQGDADPQRLGVWIGERLGRSELFAVGLLISSSW